MNIWKLYESEVRRERAKYPGTVSRMVTERDIKRVPEPVRRYFRHCGYVGKPWMKNAEVIWDEVQFKMSPGGLSRGMALGARRLRIFPGDDFGRAV